MHKLKHEQSPVATLEVPSELIACMIEITSDIGFMLDIGSGKRAGTGNQSAIKRRNCLFTRVSKTQTCGRFIFASFFPSGINMP